MQVSILFSLNDSGLTSTFDFLDLSTFPSKTKSIIVNTESFHLPAQTRSTTTVWISRADSVTKTVFPMNGVFHMLLLIIRSSHHVRHRSSSTQNSKQHSRRRCTSPQPARLPPRIISSSSTANSNTNKSNNNNTFSSNNNALISTTHPTLDTGHHHQLLLPPLHPHHHHRRHRPAVLRRLRVEENELANPAQPTTSMIRRLLPSDFAIALPQPLNQPSTHPTLWRFSDDSRRNTICSDGASRRPN